MSLPKNYNDNVFLNCPFDSRFKEVIRVGRERTVKDPPKRGKLTKRQAQRAVEKVVGGKRGRRDAKTGRFISRKEAERGK